RRRGIRPDHPARHAGRGDRRAAHHPHRPPARLGRPAMNDHTVPSLEVTDAVLELGDGDSRVRALDEVSLTVMPGEFVAIVGPSGSGKSSLLAIAGALSRPDSGTVRVHGTDLGRLSRGAASRFRLRNIGFVFQSGNL